MSQQGLNWKQNVKFELVQKDNTTSIEGDGKEIWSTGKFKCANRLEMRPDGNLRSMCDESPMWSMEVGNKGPKRLGK